LEKQEGARRSRRVFVRIFYIRRDAVRHENSQTADNQELIRSGLIFAEHLNAFNQSLPETRVAAKAITRDLTMHFRQRKHTLHHGIWGTLLAGLGLVAGPVQALVITEEVAFCELAVCDVLAQIGKNLAPAVSSDSFSQTGAVPKFNPALGNLSQVRFFFEISGNAALKADSPLTDDLDSPPQEMDFDYLYELELVGNPFVVTLVQGSGLLEGIVGALGAITLDSATEVVSGAITPVFGNLAYFIGLDTFDAKFSTEGTLTGDPGFDDNTTFTGSVAWFGDFQDRGGRFAVEYTYTPFVTNPVPEPGTLLLTSLGLLAGAGALSRRKVLAV